MVTEEDSVISASDLGVHLVTERGGRGGHGDMTRYIHISSQLSIIPSLQKRNDLPYPEHLPFSCLTDYKDLAKL